MALWLRAEGIEVKMLSPMNTIQEAVRTGLISDADAWSAAVERRNVIAHTYDADAFSRLIADAGTIFLPHLEAVRARLREFATG